MSQDNAYARLGVSPLASTEEIAARIAELRGKAMKLAKAKAVRSVGTEEEEIFRLDRIDEEIGKPAARKKYDEKHPQNVLLTVQPSQAEQTWLPYRKAGLVSEWLYEELERDAFVPSLRCLELWAPGGLDEQLVAILSRFVSDKASDDGAVTQPPMPADEGLPSRVLSFDLERLLKEKEDV
jgi:hypothetical protein